jgi:hypothetical protein
MILAMQDEIDLWMTAPSPTSQDGRAAPAILRQTPYAATSTMISRFGLVMSLTR